MAALIGRIQDGMVEAELVASVDCKPIYLFIYLFIYYRIMHEAQTKHHISNTVQRRVPAN